MSWVTMMEGVVGWNGMGMGKVWRRETVSMVRWPRRGRWEHEDTGTSIPPLCAAHGTGSRTGRTTTLLLLLHNARYHSRSLTAAITTRKMRWYTTTPAACTQCVPPRPARAGSCPCAMPALLVVPAEEPPVTNDGGRGGG